MHRKDFNARADDGGVMPDLFDAHVDAASTMYRPHQIKNQLRGCFHQAPASYSSVFSAEVQINHAFICAPVHSAHSFS